MAASTDLTAAEGQSQSPYQLDPNQVLKAAKALLAHIKNEKEQREAGAEKKDVLADADEEEIVQNEPIWLLFTAKRHIIDKARLKPGKIPLPHSLMDANATRVCLITADPQRAYKDIVAHPSFPKELGAKIARVIGIAKLKAKYKSFEAKRQLFAEYDAFLCDERVVTYMPHVLGKVFYKSGLKRPIPVCLTGKERTPEEKKNRPSVYKTDPKRDRGSTVVGKPVDVAKDIEKALNSALVHLAPSATTSVKVGLDGFTSEMVRDNTEAVVKVMTEKYIPKQWRGLKSIHMKTPNSASLPVWMASELWTDEADVLDEKWEAPVKEKKSKKRKLLAGAEEGQEKTEVDQTAKKSKSVESQRNRQKPTSDDSKLDKEIALRKEKLKAQKAQAMTVA